MNFINELRFHRSVFLTIRKFWELGDDGVERYCRVFRTPLFGFTLTLHDRRQAFDWGFIANIPAKGGQPLYIFQGGIDLSMTRRPERLDLLHKVRG